MNAEDLARAAGPLPVGHFRVVVIESDSRVTTHDFSELARAVAFANDAASESDLPAPIAWVLDGSLRRVHRGAHYGSSQ